MEPLLQAMRLNLSLLDLPACDCSSQAVLNPDNDARKAAEVNLQVPQRHTQMRSCLLFWGK